MTATNAAKATPVSTAMPVLPRRALAWQRAAVPRPTARSKPADQPDASPPASTRSVASAGGAPAVSWTSTKSNPDGSPPPCPRPLFLGDAPITVPSSSPAAGPRNQYDIAGWRPTRYHRGSRSPTGVRAPSGTAFLRAIGGGVTPVGSVAFTVSGAGRED